MDNNVKFPKDNQIWDFVDTPKKHKILSGKWIYKLMYTINGKSAGIKLAG